MYIMVWHDTMNQNKVKSFKNCFKILLSGSQADLIALQAIVKSMYLGFGCVFFEQEFNELLHKSLFITYRQRKANFLSLI